MLNEKLVTDTRFLPNLLLAGVAKAGSSSLFWYLIQHPDICPPADRKEIDYFTPIRFGREIRGTPEDYAGYFAHQSGQPFRLDGSPHYFDGGGPLIKAVEQLLPHARILIILRDPTSRLWSSFRSQKEAGKLPPDYTFQQYFQKSLELRERGKDRLWESRRYRSLSQGCYNEHLKQWFETFDTNVRIVFFEHLVKNPQRLIRDTCHWLGIDASPVDAFDYAVRNRTVDPRSVALSKFAHVVNFRVDPLLRRYPTMKELARSTYSAINSRRRGEELSHEDREMVVQFYSPANASLRTELTRRGYRDFPGWLSEPPEPI